MSCVINDIYGVCPALKNNIFQGRAFFLGLNLEIFLKKSYICIDNYNLMTTEERATKTLKELVNTTLVQVDTLDNLSEKDYLNFYVDASYTEEKVPELY